MIKMFFVRAFHRLFGHNFGPWAEHHEETAEVPASFYVLACVQDHLIDGRLHKIMTYKTRECPCGKHEEKDREVTVVKPPDFQQTPFVVI